MDFTLVHVSHAEHQATVRYADFGQLLSASLDPALTLNPPKNA